MSTADFTSKEEVRSLALQRRNGLPEAERAAASLRICNSLMDSDLFLDARGVHVYLPIGTEVDIRPLINMAWEMQKEVGLMRVMEDGGSLQYRIVSDTEYRLTTLGILEPVDAERFDMNICDLILTPLLAADEQCNRLGYGKGYYDQFLLQNPRPTIGAAFDCQIFPSLPTDEFDVKLDEIYTDTRIITTETTREHRSLR